MGKVINASSQHYMIQQNGAVMSASLSSIPIDTNQPLHLDYLLDATVQGLTASGHASFHLTGHVVGGMTLNIIGNAQIVGMMPAVCLPSLAPPDAQGNCESTDTSGVPAFFVGMAAVQVTMTGAPTQTKQVPMLFKSAYLDPFGAPIVFGSVDNFKSFLVITPYTRATIDWHNVVIEGQIGGTLGSTPISGAFTQVSQEHENLLTGTARDFGVMTFSSVVNPATGQAVSSLDVTGRYMGNSIIPSTTTYACLTSTGVSSTCQNSDCSPMIRFPLGFGVCTSTGFQSMGQFNLHGHSNDVRGSYATSWSVPAFGFAGMASGTATSGYHNHG